MGASYSSEEEGGEDMAGGVTKRSVTEEQVDNALQCDPQAEGGGGRDGEAARGRCDQ